MYSKVILTHTNLPNVPNHCWMQDFTLYCDISFIIVQYFVINICNLKCSKTKFSLMTDLYLLEKIVPFSPTLCMYPPQNVMEM